jgi:ABC-2 type transport system permease protein
MRAYRVLLVKELAEQWRTGRLLVVAVVFLIFGLTSPFLAKYTPEIVKLAASSVAIHVPTPTMKDAVAQLVKNLSQLGALVAILLTMGTVAGEKESGTAAFIIVKPVSRFAFLAAKFCGLALTMLGAVAVCGAAAYVYTVLLFAAPSVSGFVAACLFMLLGLLVIASVTFLGSTLSRSAIPAATLGVVALVVEGVVASVPNMARFTPSGLDDLANKVALQQSAADWYWSVLFNGAVVAVTVAASWLVFRRQEL